MQYDNPAARLLAILTEGKKISSAEPCRKTWAGLLDTPKHDHALLVSRIGKLMNLPQEIIDQTKQLFPSERPTWEHWSKQVSTGFTTQNLNGQWETFISSIDDHTLTYLTMSAGLLQSKSNIKKLDLDKLLELRKDIEGLIVMSIDLDIDVEIKKYVIHHLRKIMIAIEEYKITGALPVLDAVECTIGHAYLDESYREFLNRNENGQIILNTLAAVANVVTVAVGVPQLTQGIMLLTGNA